MDWDLYLRAALALIAVLALIALLTFVMRRVNGARFGGSARAERRIRVITSTAVDARRRAVLIRRDSVEHLVLLGGPNDLLLESFAAVAEQASAEAAPSDLPGRKAPSFGTLS